MEDSYLRDISEDILMEYHIDSTLLQFSGFVMADLRRELHFMLKCFLAPPHHLIMLINSNFTSDLTLITSCGFRSHVLLFFALFGKAYFLIFTFSTSDQLDLLFSRY